MPQARGSSRRGSNLAPADAALLGWLEYAARRDPIDAESIDAFIEHGHLLCSGGYGSRRIEGRLVDEWRVLAARGAALIGPALDPEDTMKVWRPRRERRRQELGRQLLESDGPPPPAPGTGTPAWLTWRRQAAAWARAEDHWRSDARRRNASERVRLGLELAWAQPAGGPRRPDRTAADPL